MKKYEFEGAKLEQRGYRVFPEELENDPCVCFHGTSEEKSELIRNEGFKIPASLPSAPPHSLTSVNFAKRSGLALRYACEARADTTKKGCILVVRFASFDGVVCNPDIVEVHRQDRMPEIIGCCSIPADYRFV
jgi:hypothetical protein